METQYTVTPLLPDDRPWLDQVQELLNEHARAGWELVAAFQYQGAPLQQADPMVQSLSHVASTIFIFQQPA